MTQSDGKGDEPNQVKALTTDLYAGRHPSVAEQAWASTTLADALEAHPEQPIGAPGGSNRDEWGQARFTSLSGVPVRRLYTQADLPEDWASTLDRHLGQPGEPPYTRGIHSTGYRGKLWTMRQFSGFATPEETNARYRYLLANGGSGLRFGDGDKGHFGRGGRRFLASVGDPFLDALDIFTNSWRHVGE